jgi:hypothetical protein
MYSSGKWQVIIGKDIVMNFDAKYIKDKIYL